MKKKETNFSTRLTVYWIFTCLCLLLLVVRLFDVQVLDRKNLKEKALKQFKSQITLPSERGSIVDRNYKILAMNVPSVDVIANPSEIQNPDIVASQLVKLFGKSRAYFKKKLGEDGSFVYIARQQSPEIKVKIDALNVNGLECQAILVRKYPKERAGCQVVGFTGIDNSGLSGIELAMEPRLRGTPGKAVLQKTATSLEFVRAEYPVIPPKNGMDVVLTVDYRYQRIAEAELRRTILETDADSGMVVVMDPRNGEILSMAGEPSFDPNRAGQFHASAWRLRAVTDQYEPGSTFKVVLMSALLNENLHTPEDTVFCENGVWEIYGEKIRDDHSYGWLSLRDVIVKSSNIGMAKLAKETDSAIFYDYAHAFGFGTKPGTELIGETQGTLRHPKDWSGMTPLAMAFGHEIAASPLQMCNMYATIANGGVLYQPQIFKEIRNNGGVTKTYPSRSIRRVLKNSTADTLKTFLRQAVKRGTGKKAEIEGFELCGKTGTAKIVLSGGRGYGNIYNSSFGGFFPKDDPQIAMFVMVNNPKRLYYGGDVAAPCFKRIAQQIVDLDGINIDSASNNPLVGDVSLADNQGPIVPNLKGYSVSSAKKIAAEFGINVIASRGKGIVVSQSIPKGSEAKEVELIAQAREIVNNADKVIPNVKGLPIRNALNVLQSLGINASIKGQGRVVSQYPKAGSTVGLDKVRLTCESVNSMSNLVSM